MPYIPIAVHFSEKDAFTPRGFPDFVEKGVAP
jgi:hypothetical protein